MARATRCLSCMDDGYLVFSLFLCGLIVFKNIKKNIQIWLNMFELVNILIVSVCFCED